MASPHPHAHSYSPHLDAATHDRETSSQSLRPPAARATSLTTFNFKARAASQPAGERIPLGPGGIPVFAPGQPLLSNLQTGSQPASGRASPHTNGYGSLAASGAKPPGRFAGALAAGTQTRANSFSAADMSNRGMSLNRTLSSHLEEHPSRSSSGSPYPTFSPASSPSTSPITTSQQLPPHSPPRVGANASRSRSQSLATGVRPDRNFMPMTTFPAGPISAGPGRFNWDSSIGGDGNSSPFSRQPPSFEASSRFKLPGESSPSWISGSASGTTKDALTSSVVKALGAAYTTQIGFDPPPTAPAGANGNRSGASSRRHSVSVVGGPGGRRDFFEGAGFGMTSPPAFGAGLDRSSARWTDADLLSDRFDNALNLDQMAERRTSVTGRRGLDIPSTSAPWSAGAQGLYNRSGDPFAEPGIGFGSSPARGRILAQGQEGTSSDGSMGSSSLRSHPVQPIGSPARGNMMDNLSARTSFTPGAIGGRPPSVISATASSFQPGAPLNSNIEGPPESFAPFGARPYPSYPNHNPAMPQQPYQNFRPPMGGYEFYPNRPPMAPPGPYSPTGTFNYPTSPAPYTFYPPASPPSAPPPLPGSPGFSSLSLADLGKGVPLPSLSPTTPLYIVVFKAGRRDVYYCPDPTLLISNGDRVIVEADRGSDLGTVIHDQLTSVDVREWQESQATKALLSGAREHLPPGVAQQLAKEKEKEDQTISGSPESKARAGRLGGAINGPPGLHIGGGQGGGGDTQGLAMDLASLLAGCGPTGASQEVSGAYVQRGPLAKEIMPKRIFAKSAQGADEQARMLEKRKDEYEAMMICREKVKERGLPMSIVDAEYQWDRRKLTFYFKADRRVDFRELTKENFRIFKSRIWMSMVPKDDPRL